jgi:hypothetical protein
MAQAFVVGLAGLTSVGAYLVGTKRLGLSGSRIPVGTVRMLELIGASFAFFVLNLAMGMTAILTVRLMHGGFLSIYLLNDTSFVVVSVIQGLIFESWRGLGRQSDPPDQEAGGREIGH